MNRRLWGGVVLTTAVLATSGTLARFAANSTADWLQNWTGELATSVGPAARGTVAAAADLGAHADVGLVVLAILATLPLIALAFAWRFVRSARRASQVRWREALRLARRGLPIGRIARRTRLAQDAVRALVQPGPALARRRVS